jgi:capping protein alpha
MADEALSNDEILRIVRHFLLSSPPGEFEDVLSDVRELVGNDELLNQGAFEIFHTYNIEQLIPVEVPGADYKVILSKYSEIDPTHYLDPHKNQVLTVDHTRGVVTSVSSNARQDDSQVKQRREALQNAVDAYVKDHYLSGLSCVFPSQDNSNEFIVCITASKFNEKNFWSGRWRSVYRVTYEDDRKAKVSGSMKVNVHYYENGNVQLNTSKEYGETVTSDNIAEDVAKVLSKTEGNFQSQVDNACNNLSETFKSLRRRLPYTKTLFDFGSNQHKLVSDMGGK